MSIYATLAQFGIKRFGDTNLIEITAQGVPPHITDVGGIYSFLPPPVDPEGEVFRAVYFVEDGDEKGTDRSHQEYVKPLLMLTGAEYNAIGFKDFDGAAGAGIGTKIWCPCQGDFYGPDGTKRILR